MKQKIVFFTGSGISQPSGLETFRDNGDGTGLWLNQKIQDVAMFSGFKKDPLKVHGFYNNLRNLINYAKPNLAHELIAQLEKNYEVVIITQNIDNLHERAGSTKVLHLHGNYDYFYCLDCHDKFQFNDEWNEDNQCPSCGASFEKVRPAIVWFNENLNNSIFDEAEEHCRTADLFVQVGTSALVLPASNLIKRVKVRRKKVEINMVKSVPNRPYTFHNYYIGNVIHSMPEFVSDLPVLLELKEKGILKTFRHKL